MAHIDLYVPDLGVLSLFHVDCFQVNSYLESMESAKKNHLNMWEYGDITADDAKEFGAR